MEEKETVREPYRMVLEGGQAELVEKKSRFIANVRPVESEAEAVAFIDEMKKKYWDARHNCSAFVIGTKAELTRCSDDGEPSGTAGRPMLEVLLGEGVRNVAVGCDAVFRRRAAGHRRTGARLFRRSKRRDCRVQKSGRCVTASV